MKLIYSILIFCFMVISQIYSQVIEYPDIVGDRQIVKYKDIDWQYDLNIDYSIGRKNGYVPNSTDNIFRSARKFDLTDIPQDATINDAKIIVTLTDYVPSAEDYKFRINAVSVNITTASFQEIFDAVGGGTVYFDNIKYSDANHLEKSSTTLKSAVQSNLTNGYISFGVQSMWESTNNSNAFAEYYLEVIYTPKVHITVENSFGGGYVNVDGSPVPSGETLPFDKGSTHTLTSFDQHHNNILYTTKNKWTNENTGQVHNQNPLTLTFNDDNVTYRAEFSAPIQVTIQNDFIGGRVKVDETEYESPANFEWNYDDQHTLEAIDQDYQAPGEPNYYRIFKEWIDPEINTFNLNPWIHNFTLGGTYTARFYRQFNINVINNLLDGGSGGEIIVNSSTVYSPYIEYLLEGDDIAVEAVPNQTIEVNGENIEYNFLNYSDREVINWGNQMPWPELGRVFTPDDHSDIDLLFKANTHTSTPDLSDTKNQRRLLIQDDTWIMVYESAGDIWLTASADAGENWAKEDRMNIRKGYAFNPSLSNIFNFGSSYDYYAVTWLEENSSGDIELHIQTMRVSGEWLFYGWPGGDYYGRVDEVNHRKFDWEGFGLPRENARPVIMLDQIGDDILMIIASETDGTGICVSRIRFEGNGYNSVCDLDDAIALKEGFYGPPQGYLGFTREISSEENHNFPVFIHAPESYGDESQNYIFYAEDDTYFPKIFQYTISDKSTEEIELPAEFSGITSMQGGASPDNATFAISVRTSAYIGGPNVIVFERPSYGGLPQLRTVYRGYDKPTISIIQESGFNSSGANHQLFMFDLREDWYYSNGYDLEYFDSYLSGVFTTEKLLNEEFTTMVTRNENIPSILEQNIFMGKRSAAIAGKTEKRFYNYYTINNEKTKPAILDFHGVDVAVIDTMLIKNQITAVQLRSIMRGGLLVRQPDSLSVPINVSIFRNGNYTGLLGYASWTQLTTINLPEIHTGDILVFSFKDKKNTKWKFKEFIYNPEFKKEKLVSDNTEIPDKESIEAFPNPFNPIAKIKYGLTEDSMVKLTVYNSLGQKVSTLVNSFKSAGYHVLEFNGINLPSGVYFFRFETENYNAVKKISLIK